MSNPDPSTDLAIKVGINVATELFKTAFNGFNSAVSWFKGKKAEHDFFGTAAKRYIENLFELYNSMNIIGMTKPVRLTSIYVRVNILEKLSALRDITIEEMERCLNHDKKSFEISHKAVDGLEAISQTKKIMVLGKPGAGKTTFLKYLALQACNEKIKCIPVYINLKDLSDSNKSLMDYIVEQFDICAFPEASPFIEKVLNDGNFIFLFDGLDEVTGLKEYNVIREIKNFSNKYNKNHFVASCRVAAYKYRLENFVNVELADFNDKQIEEFIIYWFGSDSNKAKKCIEKLNRNRSIKSLAVIPLLLTLLCLDFDERMDFPQNRADLYSRSIETLLTKWDGSRGIERAEIYKNLSTRRKENMLSRISYQTFEQGRYFFPKRVLVNHISEFIQNLPNINQQTLEPDSTDILQAIEAQHGLFVERARDIYSFSHLTFQEYFTAKYIADNEGKGTLEKLVNNYLTNEKWREVFLLTSGLLVEGDKFFLLMKNKIDSMVSIELAKFIDQVHSNALLQECILSVFTDLGNIKDQFLRAAKLYIVFTHTKSSIENRGLARDIPLIELGREIGSGYFRLNAIVYSLMHSYTQYLISNYDNTLGFSKDTTIDYYLNRLYTFSQDFSRVVDLTRDLNLANDVKNNFDLAVVSNSYFTANQLLLDCLNAACYVTKETRQRILDGLLLIPIKYRQQPKKAKKSKRR